MFTKQAWWFQIFCIFAPTCGNDPIWPVFFGWNQSPEAVYTRKVLSPDGFQVRFVSFSRGWFSSFILKEGCNYCRPRESKDQTWPIGSRESFIWIILKTILCLVLDFQGIDLSKVKTYRWALRSVYGRKKSACQIFHHGKFQQSIDQNLSNRFCMKTNRNHQISR